MGGHGAGLVRGGGAGLALARLRRGAPGGAGSGTGWPRAAPAAPRVRPSRARPERIVGFQRGLLGADRDLDAAGTAEQQAAAAVDPQLAAARHGKPIDGVLDMHRGGS